MPDRVVFLAPALLLVLLALPLLWWLLRATPPSPRLQDFPAVRLLTGLKQNEETPARTPPWLLALRLLAAALLVVGVAGPVLQRSVHLGTARTRPLLLVIDDGWASAHDWQRRLAACGELLADAGRAHRRAALLTTAPDDDGAVPSITPFEPADALRTRVAALRAHPWSVDRTGAARALATLPAGAADVDYVADDVATASDRSFARALRRIGPVDDLRDPKAPARLLLAPVATADRMLVRLVSTAPIRSATVLAIDERGGALATVHLGAAAIAGAAYGAEGRIDLPLELRNQLSRLVVEGAPAAATTRLLDESDRRRPVGLLDDGPGSDTPLIGPLFYVSRGLQPYVELRQGGIATLLSRPLSVMIVADRTLADPVTHARIEKWVRGGGMLIRFAGPRVAAMDADESGPIGDSDDDQADTGGDPLLPVQLLPGSRALGGVMSWGKPQHLAPFPPGSPFAGLHVPAEVTVSRQVLAKPSLDLAAHTWVMLADRTPLVTERRLGQGRVVLFHVTANADWSNLPLSGLFVQMLERLTKLAAGIASPGDHTLLPPVLTLDADGALGAPTQAAIGLQADAFGTVPASPRHPPGLYGRLAERRSLNLADAMPPITAEAVMGRSMSLERHRADLALGPWLIGAAALLLAADLLASLAVRGLLVRATGVAALLLLAFIAPHAGATEPGPLPATSPRAALETELAYVVTGQADVDNVSRDGLSSLSDYVNAHTAAVLGTPAAVTPGRDDLSFFPLIYWPILPDATADPKAVAALDAYMRTGGVVLIDTEGGDPTSLGSGAGFAPGAPAALRRVAAGLDVPPLMKLSSRHVLAHSFYLLHDFPGRFEGAPVWVERGGDPSNDGVSTVIIGGNAWAAAWATGGDGQPEFSVLPNGDEQRLLAFRFGVNLVMYALTGNYKSDQVHIPALLQRLGQDGGGLTGPATSAPDDGP